MKKQLRNSIIKYVNKLTDDELEKLYYDTVYMSLGSITETMYERGYDFIDIEEQEKFEKFLCEKVDLLEKLCTERGIVLWQNKKNNHP